MMPAIIIVVVFTVIPFIAASTDAFQSAPDKHHPLQREASFDQFKFMLKDPAFHDALYNSLMYAAISVPLIMILSLIIAAAISNVLRKALRGF